METAEDWKLTKLPELLQTYSADNIYNADETGLFYRAMPDGSLVYKYEKLVGSKKALDRITVLCCANMSGSDKRKLLIVGKAAKPRCFKGIAIERLPAQYLANKNAWMTSLIFESWLKEWDRSLQQESRKIVLIVNNCAAHPHCTVNTISLIQPMDMGVIKNLKTEYRKRLVHHILLLVEENIIGPASTAVEISSKVNILEAIQFVADSWRAVDDKIIRNCFAHCGFKYLENETLQTEESNLEIGMVLRNEERNLDISQCLQNYEDCVNIDNDVVCFDTDSHAEEDEIIAAIVQRNDPEQEGDEGHDSQVSPVNTSEAHSCISKLRLYFIQEGNSESPLTSLDICADFVYKQMKNNVRQKTIDEYFKKV